MKRIFCIAFISIACCFSFLTGYFSLYSVPVYGAQDEWETLTSNDQLVDAFKIYCKSRNVAIDGSVLDALTLFTTKTFNNICNTLGIDMTLLQAEIQRLYSGTGYKYAFSASGLSGFNRIFAEFLQNNDLSVGDTVADKVLYNGKYLDNTLVYVITGQLINATSDSKILQYGTPYQYTGQDLVNLYQSGTRSVTLFDTVFPIHFGASENSYFKGDSLNFAGYQVLYKKYNPTFTYNGHLCIASVNNNLYLSSFLKYVGNVDSNKNKTFYNLRTIKQISSSSAQDVNINLTTNNQTINNETVINEGDTIIYNNDGTPDSGGGGGDQGDDWNPVLPEVPPAGSDPSGGNTINWPDLDLPDFELSDFSLGDLRLKFPFSIPFDIVSILGVINAPPVAPVIQEDIPIRIDLMNVDYTIPINLDMSDSLYDNFAVLVRAVEFIGFCIGLIHLTIRLVKG